MSTYRGSVRSPDAQRYACRAREVPVRSPPGIPSSPFRAVRARRGHFVFRRRRRERRHPFARASRDRDREHDGSMMTTTTTTTTVPTVPRGFLASRAKPRARAPFSGRDPRLRRHPRRYRQKIPSSIAANPARGLFFFSARFLDARSRGRGRGGVHASPSRRSTPRASWCS